MNATLPLVLLVEDEPSISDPLSAALARAGFEPVVAATLSRARALLSQRRPDLVLLDIEMPDGDGLDLCRELRRNGDLPVIVVTARGSDYERAAGFEAGADDYVVKPFSGIALLARMRALLGELPA